MRITVSPTKSEDKRVYSVKVMNRGRKREYTMRMLTLDNNFSTVADMKESLTSALKFPFDNFGYIEPGHQCHIPIYMCIIIVNGTTVIEFCFFNWNKK